MSEKSEVSEEFEVSEKLEISEKLEVSGKLTAIICEPELRSDQEDLAVQGYYAAMVKVSMMVMSCMTRGSYQLKRLFLCMTGMPISNRIS